MKKLVSLFLILALLFSSISFAALSNEATPPPSRIAESEVSGSGAVISTTHVYLNGKEITSIDSDGKRLFYHQDYLGSTRIITDVNGSLVARIDYAPFGEELVDTTKTKYTFTGKEEDASTRLQNFGARYYDPEIGRFTRVDPMYDTSKTPYEYANNNPLKLVDPDGKKEIKVQYLHQASDDIINDAMEFFDLRYTAIARDTPGSSKNIPRFVFAFDQASAAKYNGVFADYDYFKFGNVIRFFAIPVDSTDSGVAVDTTGINRLISHEVGHSKTTSGLFYTARYLAGAVRTLIPAHFSKKGIEYNPYEYADWKEDVTHLEEGKQSYFDKKKHGDLVVEDYLPYFKWVEKVLDKYGFEGRTYMDSHLPTIEETGNPRGITDEYIPRMMRELDKKHKR